MILLLVSLHLRPYLHVSKQHEGDVNAVRSQRCHAGAAEHVLKESYAEVVVKVDDKLADGARRHD